MKIEPRNKIEKFSLVMEERLRENDYRGTWKNERPEYLTKQLIKNLDDLLEAMKSGNMATIPIECADIANYCMMIADYAGALE